MKTKIKKKKVLFICTGGPARSLMAEAILNQFGSGNYEAFSASGRPTQRINIMTLKVLKSHNIMSAKLKSRSWDEFMGKNFDIVVTICKKAEKEFCPQFPANSQKLHWDIPEPGKGKRTELTKLEDFYKIYRMLSIKMSVHFLG